MARIMTNHEAEIQAVRDRNEVNVLVEVLKDGIDKLDGQVRNCAPNMARTKKALLKAHQIILAQLEIEQAN